MKTQNEVIGNTHRKLRGESLQDIPLLAVTERRNYAPDLSALYSDANET